MTPEDEAVAATHRERVMAQYVRAEEIRLADDAYRKDRDEWRCARCGSTIEEREGPAVLVVHKLCARVNADDVVDAVFGKV